MGWNYLSIPRTAGMDKQYHLTLLVIRLFIHAGIKLIHVSKWGSWAILLVHFSVVISNESFFPFVIVASTSFMNAVVLYWYRTNCHCTVKCRYNIVSFPQQHLPRCPTGNLTSESMLLSIEHIKQTSMQVSINLLICWNWKGLALGSTVMHNMHACGILAHATSCRSMPSHAFVGGLSPRLLIIQDEMMVYHDQGYRDVACNG